MKRIFQILKPQWMDKILAADMKAISLETGYCSSLSSYCLYCFGSLYAGGNVWFSLSEDTPRLKAHTTFHNALYRKFITRCDDSSTLQQLAFFTYDSSRHF